MLLRKDGDKNHADGDEAELLAFEVAVGQANKANFKSKDSVPLDPSHSSWTAVPGSISDKPDDYVTEAITAEGDLGDYKK